MSEQPREKTQEERPVPGVKQATFRMPRVAVVAAVIAMISGTPFAWSSWWLATVYLLPLGFIFWVLRNQTVVDTKGLTARSTFRTTVVGWDELKGLGIKRAKVRAVRKDDSVVPLPGVRTRHLPMLAAFSGGRIADPSKRSEPAEASGV